MRDAKGLAEAIADLARDGRVWVHLGTVQAIEEHESWGYLLDVALQPGETLVQCRPVWAMGGAQGEGFYAPIAVDDEVIVLCPGGDLNQALAWPGPPSAPSKPPEGWANDRFSLVHEGGLEVRTTPAATVEPAMKAETFQADLSAFLSAFDEFLAALGSATDPAVLAAAPALQVAIAALPLPGSLAAGGYSALALKTE
ncbi:hypothetical protein [uncultured Nocardioides sp.]|uniref:hypothetical protein n=1 Tax=uncultured Nocardioides sp. TaxID=198441 RepID=UPI0026079B67|nr:hypothetical protein [uncultured Nocardioides sp.]